MNKDLVSIADLTADEMRNIFQHAIRTKADLKAGKLRTDLAGKSVAMLFEKPSLRTRVTFEVGLTQLGGHAVYLAPSDIQLGKRESVADVARNLSRWVDGIVARTFAHDTITELAAEASKPVVNALSDREHPCQALADLLTVVEKKGDNLTGRRLVFVGDGNNVAHSLMLLCGLLGMDFVLACPEGYEAAADIVEQARRLASESGAVVEQVHDPAAAVADADVVYTDVWTSMGQEAETAERRRVFAPFQVNAELMRHAPADALVMHCLPAHRGEEITDEVLDGPQSVVLDEAENRLHAQKAVLTELIH